MSDTRKLIRLVIIVAFFLVTLPFILNRILQIRAFTVVIGSPETWLSFWATYIGAVLTALMVLATFVTIRRTSNLNKAQWRIDWLNSFRSAAAELIVATDSTAVGQMAQDIQFYRFGSAVDQGHETDIAVKRCSYLVSSLLKEYNTIYDTNRGEDYIETLNGFLRPFCQTVGELIQFAIICKYLKDKKDANQYNEGINALRLMIPDMESNRYLVIRDAIRDIVRGESMDVVVHDSIVTMQKNYSALNIQGLEPWLLKLGAKNAKVAYGMSLMSVEDHGKSDAES